MAGLFPPPDYRKVPGILAPQPAPQLVTVMARGQSGRTYEFQIDQIGTAYHARPGVYIFMHKAPNGGWDADYIGQTRDFDRRLNTDLRLHHRWQSICTARSTHIGTLQVPNDPQLRLSIETDLIRAYDPPCNRQ